MRAILATGTAIAAIVIAIGWSHVEAQEAALGQETQSPISGEELFLREWLPNDPRSHAGDGLGPVFNETSCVACHNQGGIGGGGSSAKNVELLVLGRIADHLTPTPEADSETADEEAPIIEGAISRFERFLESLRLSEKKKRENRISPAERAKMAQIHPGFRDGNSVVLHRFGSDPNYSTWRDEQRLGETARELEKELERVPASTRSKASISVDDDVPPPFDDSPHGRMRRAVADFNRDGHFESIHDPWLVVKGRSLLRMGESLIGFARQVVTGLSSTPGQELSLSSLTNSIPSNRVVGSILVEKQLGLIGSDSFFNMMMNQGEAENSRIQRIRSLRNPTALFGVGRIDSIPTRSSRRLREDHIQR